MLRIWDRRDIVRSYDLVYRWFETNGNTFDNTLVGGVLQIRSREESSRARYIISVAVRKIGRLSTFLAEHQNLDTMEDKAFESACTDTNLTNEKKKKKEKEIDQLKSKLKKLKTSRTNCSMLRFSVKRCSLSSSPLLGGYYNKS